MNAITKIKNMLFTAIALVLWLRFLFAIADPHLASFPDAQVGLPIYQDWRPFLSFLYMVTNILMAPMVLVFKLIKGILPTSWTWLPAVDSAVVLEWLRAQSVLQAAQPMLAKPELENFMVGQYQWLALVSLPLYHFLSGFADKAYEYFKNLIWNVMIEFSFTKKKQAAYQQTLEKRAADLMKLKVEYRNLSKEASVLAETAITDELTKLYNKRFFIQCVQDSFKNAKEKKELFAIVMVDIDHFKKLNDTYGHLMGDKVLKEVAAQVKKHSPKGTFACRFGGEEFSVIMPRKNPLEAEAIAEAIHKTIPELRFEEDPNLVVTISMGMLSTNFENEKAQALNSFEDTIKLADDELYRAKLNGRNRIEHNKLI